MARNRQLDLACRSPARWQLIRSVAIVLLLACISLLSAGQPSQPDLEHVSYIKQLFEQGRWQEIVRLAEAVPVRSAELDYYYGSALAQLGRLAEARQALLSSHRQQATDKRFLVELAGVEFKHKDYPAAADWLRQALERDPADAYVNDFLGSVYFLEGNLEAALQFWNRVGKPQIATVRLEPEPRINAALLDTAFAFPPASTLYLRDLLSSWSRISGLEIFPTYTFDLAAREDGRFDVVFRASQREGWRRNKWGNLFSLFRGVFQQTIYPEFFNVGDSAMNVVSSVRWDSEKRRLMSSVSGPWRDNAKWRYRVGLDLRNENWDIRPSFIATAPLLGSLNLRREGINGEISSFASGRWNWSTGAELSHRDFRSVLSGPALSPQLLAQGFQLKHLAEMNYELLRLPENRFAVHTGMSSQTGRIWSQPSHSFMKVQGSVTSHWFPQSSGDDYEVRAGVRAGKTFGQVPFDELFLLGLERDNDLLLRGHIGTRDGRKGSAPIGRNYFLANSELDKNVYRNGLFGVKLGPFLDTGRITDVLLGLGTRTWLWDTGLQAKVQALGVGIIFSYGKDLRSGTNAFYVRVGR
jgi:tetratricopeptide (TPR) repeat protein